MTFAGRVEARWTVPSGTQASVSSGALTSAVNVTLPAANYFHTAAGGVSSGITALQTAINAAVTPYPQSAAAMAAALGYGNWTTGAAWNCDEASGNLAAAFGSPTLTASGTPTYGTTGPGHGGDKAVGFDAGTERFDGGDVFDVTDTEDLIVLWVAKLSVAVSGTVDFIVSKLNPGSTAGYQIGFNTSGSMFFYGQDAALAQLFNFTQSTDHLGEWHVGIAAIDRAAGKARIGTRSLGGTSSLSTDTTIAATTMTNAAAFRVGDRADNGGGAPQDTKIAYVGVVAGSGVATGLTTNLSTALTNFANAVNSAFTVSLSTTTGLVSLSNSFWPSSISFTSTALRDLLGYEYNFDYPQTAAQMATALGYGTWTGGAGYLLNETSGNPAAIFGSPSSLTATSLTYSNLGPRGGSDLAVGFDAGTDNADGGDVYDITSTDDFCLVALVNLSSAPAAERGLFTKFSGTIGWFVQIANTGALHFGAFHTGGSQDFLTGDISPPLKEWCVLIAAIDRATGKACLGMRSLATGTSVVTSLATANAVSYANASAMRIGQRADAGVAAATESKVAAMYVVAGSGVAAGIPANMTTALSNFATYMKAQTGTEQARGLWFPDCPMNLDGDPTQTPKATDLRQSESPTGVVLGLVGNTKYRHRNLRWEAVPRAQVWDSAATYENGSYEEFLVDTQFGTGHEWFTPSSRVQVYWDNAGSLTLLGGSGGSGGTGVSGWYLKGVASIEPRMTSPPWTGLWAIEWPELVSDG